MSFGPAEAVGERNIIVSEKRDRQSRRNAMNVYHARECYFNKKLKYHAAKKGED